MNSTGKRKRILTGVRPTGALHIGHLFGALLNWKRLQEEYDCTFLIADYQVLNDHLEETALIPANTREVLLDWLAVGLDPAKANFVQQSRVPQLAELTMIFSFLVTVSRLRRNPTIKEEAGNVGIDSDRDDIPFGFLGYPVSQAADILLWKADLVPAGEDQRPHLEQTREAARSFNRHFGETFPEPEILLSETPKVLGLDGRKMSKSLGNAILLSDPNDQIVKKVKRAKTDSGETVEYDPARPEISNLVTLYAAATGITKDQVKEKFAGKRYGDFKKDLADRMVELIEPIRTRRDEYARNMDEVRRILDEGTERGRAVGKITMDEVLEKVFGYSKI